VLLLAPLARAAALEPDTNRLRESLRKVLDATTVADARDVYVAIRRASPGGLGQAEEQDVSTDPTVTLTDAMELAADRDAIASEARLAGQREPAADCAIYSVGVSVAATLAAERCFVFDLAPPTHIARRVWAVFANTEPLPLAAQRIHLKDDGASGHGAYAAKP